MRGLVGQHCVKRGMVRSKLERSRLAVQICGGLIGLMEFFQAGVWST